MELPAGFCTFVPSFFATNLSDFNLLHLTFGRIAAEDNAKPTQATSSSEPTISIRNRTFGGQRRASNTFGCFLRDYEDYGSYHRGSAHVITMGSMNVALCGLFFFHQ